MSFESTKVIELGSTAFRQWGATHSRCKYVHGYQLKAKFWFSAKTLDNKNWVYDFGGLKGLKNILQEHFDHKLVVAADDPQLELFKTLAATGAADLKIMPGVGVEKFAEYCRQQAQNYVSAATDGRVSCTKVEVFEHQDNSAIFSL